MKIWNILLPGPSLSRLTERPPGEVVSVNAAIRLPAVPDPDYFCALDSPLSLGAQAGPEENPLFDTLRRNPPHRLWTSPENAPQWREYGFPNLEVIDVMRPRLEWLPRLMKRSIFGAILGALLHGARVIHLWGCDMEGEAYFDGPGHAWGDARWKTESQRLSKLVEAADRQGIQIGRR